MSATAARDATRDEDFRRLVALLFALGGLAVLAGAAVVVAWSLPAVAAWVHSGRLPSLGVVDALRALGEPELRSGDPGAAYPAEVRALLPGAWGFWTSGALLWITIATAVVAVAREVELRMSRPTADRRWWQLRGRRPHEFGRYRTARELAVNGPSPDRVIVGTFARPAALLAVQPNVQMLLVGAPRSGKTSAGLIPPLLEHAGPAVATSVRTDVVRETGARRRRLGDVWVWDPFGERSDAWDPLAGCERWEHALLVARWLGHAVTLGQGHTQEYFDQEAEGLTAPLLHAAASTTSRTIVDVYRWILRRERDEPERILGDLGAADALERLRNVYSYTERQRDGIIGTAAVQLKAYGHPAAARTAARADGVSPIELFAPGAANTLYIVAGREH
jgi:type IV secretion system protein VirD4